MFIIEKYVKIGLKNRGRPCYFLEVRRSKILLKLNKRDCFCNILGLVFYGVSHAKTDLRIKYIFNFLFGSFFEQDHLLNLFILGVYSQRWPNAYVFQNRNWGPFHRKESKWKNGVRGKFMKNRKLCMQNLTKEWKQLPVVILQQTNFYNIFILCLWLRIIRRSDQGVKFINFSFTDIFFNSTLYECRYLLLLWKGER